MVIGISYDKPGALHKFKENHRLPFILLSDHKKKVARLYDSGNFLFASRKTFIINRQGIVEKIYEKLNVNTHAGEILKYFETDEE